MIKLFSRLCRYLFACVRTALLNRKRRFIRLSAGSYSSRPCAKGSPIGLLFACSLHFYELFKITIMYSRIYFLTLIFSVTLWRVLLMVRLANALGRPTDKPQPQGSQQRTTYLSFCLRPVGGEPTKKRLNEWKSCICNEQNTCKKLCDMILLPHHDGLPLAAGGTTRRGQSNSYKVLLVFSTNKH